MSAVHLPDRLANALRDALSVGTVLPADLADALRGVLVPPSPSTSGAVPALGGNASDAATASGQGRGHLAAALADGLANELDAAGAEPIRLELGIPADADFTDRQIIEHVLTVNDPDLRAYYARLIVSGYLRALPQLGLAPETLAAYAVHGLENLNIGVAEGFAEPAPVKQHKRDDDYWRDQLALFVASAVAYLRARGDANQSQALRWLRGIGAPPAGAAWQPRPLTFLRGEKTYLRLDEAGRRNPAHHDRIRAAALAGESERLGHGPMPEVLDGLGALEAAIVQSNVR